MKAPRPSQQRVCCCAPSTVDHDRWVIERAVHEEQIRHDVRAHPTLHERHPLGHALSFEHGARVRATFRRTSMATLAAWLSYVSASPGQGRRRDAART